LLRRLAPLLHQLDHAFGRFAPHRDVLVEVRTPVYLAVLGPLAEALAQEAGVRVWFTSEYPDRMAALVPAGSFLTHPQVEWRRLDLYLNGDPWAAARLRRCAHRINFFHGVAGKYDLDRPTDLPLGFQYYDRVAFINRDRMERYLAAGIVTPRQAVLVGYPKLDRLVNGGFDGAAIRASLGLDPARPTALYAPTYSEASSLHVAGEAIVRSLAAAGFNVLIKLHDRSLDPDPRYNAGIDWRARFLALERPGQVCFIERSDSSPLLAAAHIMVTDHSTIGFEYLLLNRPLLVFDAPDLMRVARINPEKVALLRRAAVVSRTPEALAAAALETLRNPGHLSRERHEVAEAMFHGAGGATARALAVIHELLDMKNGSSQVETARAQTAGGGAA
jgi:hypothetical protein